MTTIPQQLLDIYRSNPERTAVRLIYNHIPDEVLSYHELLHRAAGYAQALAKASIQPGEVVILILQHGEGLVTSFFGAILHGAIPSIMPFLTEKLSPEHYRRSLQAIFEITKPAAVITYPEFLDELQDALSSNDSVRHVLLCTDIRSEIHLDPQQFAGVSRTAQDIVLLQHSSGTTGLQKGVALSHQAVFNQLESYTDALQMNDGDLIISWLPLYHDMGLIAGFILPILSNVPLTLLSPFDWVRAPYKLLQAVSQHRGTLTWLPNFAFNFCAQKIRPRDLEGVDLSSWRAVINCSEPMYWSSHQIFMERFQPFGLNPEALATCYAMAENVFAVTQGGINAPVNLDRISQSALLSERIARPATDKNQSIKMLSAGVPIDGVSVRVFDDNHQELPERHVGEIALNSNCMLTAYFNRPDLTENAFHEGWYLTGDLGYIASGEVYITGRKKDLIIVGGKNIYPQDLEALANEVPGVHSGRVAAFGILNEGTGTEDVVIIAEVEISNQQPLNEQSPDPQKIADEIRLRVTRNSEISLRYVKLVERGWLLKTSSGKVARNANKEKYINELSNGW